MYKSTYRRIEGGYRSRCDLTIFRSQGGPRLPRSPASPAVSGNYNFLTGRAAGHRRGDETKSANDLLEAHKISVGDYRRD